MYRFPHGRGVAGFVALSLTEGWDSLLSWLASAVDYLGKSWLGPALVAILVAAYSAKRTLNSNIRLKAWERVFEEKRQEIRTFLATVDRFATCVIRFGEVNDIRNDRPMQKAANLLFWARQLWGPDLQNSANPSARFFLTVLPPFQDAVAGSAGAADRLEQARMLLVNELLERMNVINVRVSDLRTQMLLTTRYPRALERAHRKIADVFNELQDARPTYEGFDFDAFGEDWARVIRPTRMRLRRDLQRSSRSLGSALAMSPAYRVWSFLVRLAKRLRRWQRFR